MRIALATRMQISRFPRRFLEVPNLSQLVPDWSEKQFTLLNARIRLGEGKRYNQALRAKHRIPGIVYGDDKNDKLLVHFEVNELNHIAHQRCFFTRIINLAVKDENDNVVQNVLVHPKTLDWNPFKSVPFDLTLKKWKPGKKIKFSVPLQLTGVGSCEAIKRGAILDIKIHEFNARWKGDHCIPSAILHDIRYLKVGDKVRFRDLYVPDGLEIPDILQSRVIIQMRPGEDSVLGDDSDDEDSEGVQQGQDNAEE
jgi:ribosomal protein L25 (general stress protein Ctc)